MRKRQGINMTSIKEDIRVAIKNLDLAYTPYSDHKVSSVLVAKDGTVFSGINIENAAFSPTICAERTAFAKAVSEGVKDFQRIIIVGGLHGNIDGYCAPCGVCRQVMMEFCDPETFKVILAKSEDDYKEYTLKEILPLGFGPKDLDE